jgi:hypothetical protein
MELLGECKASETISRAKFMPRVGLPPDELPKSFNNLYLQRSGKYANIAGCSGFVIVDRPAWS